MLILAWKILVAEAMLAGRSARQAWRMLLGLLPPVVREMRCARRMDSLAARLSTMRRKIATFEARVLDGSFEGAVDADLAICGMLKGLKEDIRHIRCEMAAVPSSSRGGYGAARLRAAMEELHDVAEDCYAAADRLLWDIGEHDMKYRT